jgi:CysZ protein
MPGVIAAFLKALAQLSDPAVVRLVGLSVLVSLLVFVLLWTGIAFLLTHTELFAWGWLETATDVLGGLATLALSWFLFPVVITAVLPLFLEGVARAVERRHYPDLGPTPGLGFFQGLFASVRFVAVMIALNVLLLGALLVPAAYPLLYFAVNGYLLGREYFEMLALRRLQPAPARGLRARNSASVLLFGILTAMLLIVPFVNLLAPVIATAAMVHLFEPWRRAAAAPPPQPPARERPTPAPSTGRRRPPPRPSCTARA